MYLIDTNIWLERLLDQKRSDEVGSFLDRIPSNRLYITDFSFHSIGVIMGRLNRMNVYLNFINDVFLKQFKLDFDDAYQYTAAEKCTFTLVSFEI